jgi:lipopolysaccharide transport system permease protein
VTRLLTLIGLDVPDLRLLWNFFRMNVRDKYLGSALGSAWAIANPLLLLTIYTLVFSYVFRLRVPGSDTTFSHTIWLICGYGPWLASTEALMAGAMSIVAAAGLVKNMAFKTELLPIAAALTGVVPLAVCTALLGILLVVDGNRLSWHAVFVLPVAVLHFGLLTALSLFFAAITVFVRDVGIALPNLLAIILFATPIFYPIEVLPWMLRVLSWTNPFFILSEAYRQALVHHEIPSPVGLAYVGLLGVGLGLFGMRLFRRLKGHMEARL